jgi:protein-S-isoprenylcysteine O-methyltransferase Ste14
MSGAILLIPFILIRFIILSILKKDALKRATHFAPMHGKERAAYWVYQLSNAGILIYLFFLNFLVQRTVFYYFSAAMYIVGILLLLLSTIYFAFPSEKGMNQKGIYLLSRNPMYVSYFVYFIGCALLTQSFILFGLVILFQISAHWIILSEEKWCIHAFGEQYIQYMKDVRRYI